MSYRDYVRRHLPPLGLGPDREQDIVDELAQQMEDTAEAARARGASAEDADATARRVVADWRALAADIGAAEQSRAVQAVRAVAAPLIVEPSGTGRFGAMLTAAWQDVRFALRILARHRGVSAAAVLTLALTIGAGTAMFSLVNAALLAPLPFTAPERVMTLTESAPALGFEDIPFSPPDFLDYQAAQTSFASLAVYRNAAVELSGRGDSERIVMAKVSPNLFDVLGVEPALGRRFAGADATSGARVAVIDHALWVRRFAADPAVIGMELRLDRQPYTIVGVLPEGVTFPMAGMRYNGLPAAAMVPYVFTQGERESRGGMYNNGVVGRLRDGVTRDAAAAEAGPLAANILKAYPPFMVEALHGASIGIHVTPLADSVTGGTRALLLVLLAAVSLLLVAGCVNVGSLLLALATRRQREMAVRASLGAGRGRLVRQLAVEHLLLAVAGGALGLGIAAVLIRLAPAALPAVLPRLHEVSLNPTVLGFSLAATTMTALIFGLAPTLRLSHVAPATALADTSRGTTGASGVRLRRVLAAAQCALAVVLLVPAGLLGRTLYTLVETSPGFRADEALTISAYLPSGGYPEDGVRVRAFYREAVDRVAALPGVTHAGASMDKPLAPNEQRGVFVDGRDPDAAPPIVVFSWVTDGYLDALGVPLVGGRLLTAADRLDAPFVVLVSERAAALLWPGQDAMGKRLRTSIDGPWATVAGIVGDIREAGLDRDSKPHVYAPIAQVANQTLGENVVGLFRNVSIVASTPGPSRAMAGMVREALREVDPQLALTPVMPVPETVAGTLGIHRMATLVVGIFALAALVIAATGLHGVMAFGVASRTREIGIRMALGASKGRVRWMVARDGLGLAVVGLAVGLAAAAGISGLLKALLVGVAPTDAVTFAAVGAVMLLVAATAIAFPARSATRVDPSTSIRDN